jgi:uncharacterized alpha-E superfamily protein
MLLGLIDAVCTDPWSVRVDIGPGALSDALDESAAALAREIGAVLAETSSVREFLSTTTGRVLGRMVDVRAVLQDGPPGTDTIDELRVQLSAFAGLWSESVLRGPAWFFGEFGRRAERAAATLSTLAAAVGGRDDAESDPAIRSRALECVLAANDSLVAYRRRHRSDVAVGDVVALLVADSRNPRSVAASLQAMQTATAEIGWFDGRDRLLALEADLSSAAGAVTDTAQMIDAVVRIRDLAGSLVASRLIVPPDPTTMGGFA